jgi:hypothetical protein
LLALFSGLHFILVRHASSDFILPVFGLLRNNHLLGWLDTAVADILPKGVVSGWYFTFVLLEKE